MNPDISRLRFSRSGKITWRVGPRAGQEFGCVNKEGYRQGKIDGKTWLSHRLLFYYWHGYLPDLVDHRNGKRLDNRKKNLRDVSRGQNVANSNKAWGATSKHRGVMLTTDRRWKMSFSFEGKRIQRYFKTELEAAMCYIELRKAAHGDFIEAT